MNHNLDKTRFKRGIAPIIIALIVAVVLGGGYAVIKQKESISVKAKDDKIVQNISGLYQNDSLGFSLMLPTGATVNTEYNDERNKSVSFDGPVNLWVVLKESSNASADYSYLDFPPSNSTEMFPAGQTTIFKAPRGYGDGGESSGNPFIVYAIWHKGYYYNIIFFGNAELDPQERKVLESFKFTK